MRRGVPFAAARDRATTDLSAPDRRLAHEIAAGVLRQRRMLDGRLAPLVSRTWRRTPADLRDVLRIGAYQLLELSRIPPYAAVETAVQLARRRRGRAAAGMVNAVLRRLAVAHPEEGNGAGVSVAARFSHPAWLVDRWIDRFGPERTEALLRHNNRRPPVVLQPVRWTRERLEEGLRAAGVAVEAAARGHGLAVRGVRVKDLPGFAEGAFVVQDPAQADLVAFADFAVGSRVWDACAAPGGKAAVLAARCRVLASDRGGRRLAVLASTLRRAAPDVRMVGADARRPPFGPAAVDAVLVDAPCTGTGTMSKHPDARWRLSPERIQRAARLQGEILEGVAPIVPIGGLLVYLTCSLEAEENEVVVNAFLARHPGFAREGDDRFIFPPDAGTDGGYGARLRRSA